MADLLPRDTASAALASSDDAATQNPSGRPTLIEIGPTASLTDTEFGTNPPTVSLIQSQSINTEAFAPQFGTTDGEGRAVAGLDPGVGAGGDDSGTKQNTAQIVRSSASTKITPRGNALDQYPSYTYNITWYLMEKGAYKTFFDTPKKSLNGMQILMRSGGASAATAGTAPTSTGPNSPTNISGATAGLGSRNSFFSNDYYIDNLELESLIMGPYNRSPHNVTRLKFTVTEPNGITLINNLWQAVNQVYKTTQLPYSLAQYCLAVRFYAFDNNGGLIPAKDNTSTDPNAIIERFYPFTISNISFRVASKQVEYQVEGLPLAHYMGFGQNLGVIKQQVELSGTTVGQVLGGQSQGSNPVPLTDGRTGVPQVQVGQGVLDAQSASNTDSSEFTNTQQPNLVSSAVTGIPGVNSTF